MHKSFPHIPVLANEVLSFIEENHKVIVDGTFGSGGHSEKILEKFKDANVIAIDKDESTQKYFEALKQKYKNRISYLHGDFSDIKTLLNGQKVDVILLDIGVSSMQLDEAERGFSFYKNASLDMRMNRLNSLDAKHVVNTYSEDNLAKIIFNYGDERKAKLIAKKIAESRKQNQISTTFDLVKIIESVIGKHKGGIHPATKTFQAIRIEVNNELGALKTALKQCSELLNINGILMVITFHSGEDEIVKKYFNQLTNQAKSSSRYSPINYSLMNASNKPNFVNITKKPISATESEIKKNTRARSAKLRVIKKLNTTNQR